MARSGQGQSAQNQGGQGKSTQRRSSTRKPAQQKSGQQKAQQRRSRGTDDAGVIPVLARAVREVEGAAERGKVGPSNRTKFRPAHA